MKLVRFTLFILFFIVGCDSFRGDQEKEVILDKNKVLKDFKSKFSAIIPDESIVTISAIKDSPIKAENLGELIDYIEDQTISGKIAKNVFEEMFKTKQNAKIMDITKSK